MKVTHIFLTDFFFNWKSDTYKYIPWTSVCEDHSQQRFLSNQPQAISYTPFDQSVTELEEAISFPVHSLIVIK